MATQNAKGADIEKKTACCVMAQNPQNLAGQRVIFAKICDRSYHCQEFASFKSTIFVARNNAVVKL